MKSIDKNTLKKPIEYFLNFLQSVSGLVLSLWDSVKSLFFLFFVFVKAFLNIVWRFFTKKSKNDAPKDFSVDIFSLFTRVTRVVSQLFSRNAAVPLPRPQNHSSPIVNVENKTPVSPVSTMEDLSQIVEHEKVGSSAEVQCMPCDEQNPIASVHNFAPSAFKFNKSKHNHDDWVQLDRNDTQSGKQTFSPSKNLYCGHKSTLPDPLILIPDTSEYGACPGFGKIDFKKSADYDDKSFVVIIECKGTNSGKTINTEKDNILTHFADCLKISNPDVHFIRITLAGPDGLGGAFLDRGTNGYNARVRTLKNYIDQIIDLGAKYDIDSLKSPEILRLGYSRGVLPFKALDKRYPGIKFVEITLDATH